MVVLTALYFSAMECVRTVKPGPELTLPAAGSGKSVIMYCAIYLFPLINL